jgi:hypothetical protein
MEVIDIFRYRASDDSFTPEDPYEVVEESPKLKWYMKATGFDEEHIVRQLDYRVQAVEDGVRLGMNSTAFHNYVAEAKTKWT